MTLFPNFTIFKSRCWWCGMFFFRGLKLGLPFTNPGNYKMTISYLWCHKSCTLQCWKLVLALLPMLVWKCWVSTNHWSLGCLASTFLIFGILLNMETSLFIFQFGNMISKQKLTSAFDHLVIFQDAAIICQWYRTKCFINRQNNLTASSSDNLHQLHIHEGILLVFRWVVRAFS